MRRRDLERTRECEQCGSHECEAVDSEQCAAWAHLADQRARFSRREES